VFYSDRTRLASEALLMVYSSVRFSKNRELFAASSSVNFALARFKLILYMNIKNTWFKVDLTKWKRLLKA